MQKNSTAYFAYLRALALLVLFILISPQVNAQTAQAEGPMVTVQLIAEQDAIVPGKTFDVALRQQITPEWHTYWRNPGDTGLASTVTWQLPEGFTAGDLQFPTPHRQRTGELVNYGYNDSTLLFTTITPPANLPLGKEITIQGKASWLVCKDICIPESASFLLTMPVKATTSPSAWSTAFMAARAQLPQTHNAKQHISKQDNSLVLTLDPLPLSADALPEEAYFFPHDGLLIQHAAAQKMVLDGRTLTLTIPLNTTRTDAITDVTGDVWLRTMNGEQSFQFTAAVEAPAPIAAVTPVDAAIPTPEKAPVPVAVASPIAAQPTTTLWTALIGAFLGGLLLNLMPCVFPVLSLKALSLIHKAHHDSRAKVIAGGLAYTAGVLVSFALLAALLVTLKSTGQQIGWGIQLQSPVFVASMALVLFVIGYVLSGAVTLGSSWVGLGQGLASKQGLFGSFFTGALAVVVATPCTAPFMGGAIFYALTQSGYVTFAVLLALGLGLALPYLLLTLFPRLLKLLPRPGLWMEHFKQFLAFPMLAAAIWMVWVLAQQVGPLGVAFILFAMLSVSFALWLFSTTNNRTSSLWQLLKKILSVVFLLLAILLIAQLARVKATSTLSLTTDKTAAQVWSPAQLAAARSEGKPVFVDMTAAWCISCLANDKTTLSSDAVQSFFAQHDVTFLKGDWTNFDQAITDYLKQFGRSGVPIYVFYPADQSKPPVVLPQLLTPSIVIDTLSPYFNPQPKDQ